jgi:hypothetical protein
VKDITRHKGRIMEDEEYETGKMFNYLDNIESLIGELRTIRNTIIAHD